MVGTKIQIIDQSAIQEIQAVETVDNSPVVLAPVFSDKGKEGWFDLKGSAFTAMFGKANFKKYGQQSIQLANAIAAGARVVGQRMVPDGSKLANTILMATVTSTPYQKTNTAGAPLYLTVGGEEVTTAEGNTAIMLDRATIKYTLESVVSAASIEAVAESAASQASATKFALYAFTDNGRGASNKKVYVVPERELSKNLTFTFYTIYCKEEGVVIDNARFSVVPDLIYDRASTDLGEVSKGGLTQFKAVSFPDQMNAFATKVSDLSGITAAELWSMDLLFGTTRKGSAVPSIVVDTEDGITLSDTNGLSLANGVEGAMGATPVLVKEFLDNKALAFFSGTVNSNIYNLDNYPIDLVFDANYSVPVKNKITELANYRKDFTFVQDYGLSCYNIDDVKTFSNTVDKSYCTTSFCQAYEVIDPYAKRQIKVTAAYDVSLGLLKHLIKYRHRPYAGVTFQAIFSSAIPDTLTYEPKVTPNIDEKAILEDLKVNYASYFNGNLVIETPFTSQLEYTQLSFSNNVLAIQQVLKALRKAFPALRYQFISNESDLEAYTSEVNSFLSAYLSNFEELRFEYISDAAYVANKIYRAAIYFQCKDFAMAELIDAYILPSGSAVA